MQPTPAPGTAGLEAAITTDALVIGAGPVGLFQVFQLGLLNIQAHVVDALPFPGGQCTQLYGDKPIYDIPAIPVCTAAELAQQLHTQAAVFQPHYHWADCVQHITPQPDSRLQVQTRNGLNFLARTVFITAGAGAFVPRTLKLDGLAAFEGTQVFYQSAPDTPPSGAVLVIGGDVDAVQRAVDLARAGHTGITLSHRRDQFDAPAALLAEMRALVATGHLALCIGLPTELRIEAPSLSALGFARAQGGTQWVNATRVEAYLGVSPTLSPLTQWGIDLERKAVRIDTATGATSLPGVFAAGDVASYPGKKKLIVCGFHEACMAAYGAQAYLWPGQNFPLQYTSSSTHLLQLLGVGSPR
ncbi:MAG: NAD(P)/FAD-dependent oxidoreductase [Rhodoferax sp.]|nr:MAG: NAD(P)/FAD-dependent oxidoreductase [Rhodoferax sp.]